MFLAVLMFFMHVFKKIFYKSVKNMFFYVFYLQINVFNIYAVYRSEVTLSMFGRHTVSVRLTIT